MLFVAAGAIAVTTALPALAAPGPHEGRDPVGEPADADCWGEVTSEVAGPLFGQHASNPVDTQEEAELPPQDRDRDTPREGVANVSKDDGNLAGDTPSDHGADVGPGFGAECEEDRND